MTRKQETELWTLGGIIAVYLIIQNGADFWENLFGTSSGDRVVPMPDRSPANDPKAIELEPKLTASTFDEMLSAYMRGFRNVTGTPPSQHMLAMLLAQSALETGRWRHMYHWNTANITTQTPRGFYRLPGDTTHMYAVYPDGVTGASAHIALLARKYPRALGAFLADTPETAAHLLKEGRFYEADEDTYARGMRALFDEFMTKVPGPVT